MVHPGARKFTGGKKGPRQVTGKRQVKATLRPGPLAEPSRSKRAHSVDTGSQDEYDDKDEDDNDQYGEALEGGGKAGDADYGYRQALRREAKPLTGFRISISGCAKTKDELWGLAVEYGAERHPGLLANTTHLVTETTDSAKYRAAVQHNIRVMKPSWIWAVKQAWVSGDDVDYVSLEKEHRWAPLAGVVACLTHFARGEHREAIKSELVWHGARVVGTFTAQVTHLVVASPLSPHSQTPPSDKLLQARKNRKALHPRLAVVWEGWVKEAAMAGGPRPEETAKWTWREDVHGGTSAAGAPAPVGEGASTAAGSAPVTDVVMNSAEIVPPTVSNTDNHDRNDQNDRNDFGTRLLDDLATHGGAHSIQAPLLPEGNQDDLRVMKKRRVAQPALQHERDPELAWALRGPEGDADADDLPNPAAVADTVSAGPGGQSGAAKDATGRTRAPGKTVIRALGEKRDETWSGYGGDDHPGPKSRPPAAGSTGAGGSRAPAGHVTSQRPEVDSRKRATDVEPVFAGQTMALMGLQGPDPDQLARVIEQYGGTALIDASSNQVDKADWIVVDYVEPSQAFFRSEDPRVVSVCWLELCIHHGELLQPADRLLERPLAYTCPVPGADALQVHFSGYPDASPALHHIRRFMTAIGATYNRQLSRKTTHLVLAALDEPRYDEHGQLCDANPSKMAKAEEWGVKVISLRALRAEVEALAGVEARPADPKSPAKLAADSELRDVTNEMRSSNRAVSPQPIEEGRKSESPAEDARSASSPAAASASASPPKSPVHRDSSSPGPMLGRPVDSPRRPSPEAPKAPQPEKKDQAKGLLRQQTSLLLAQLGGTDSGGPSDVAKPRAGLSRARSLRERSTETSFSARRPVDTQSLRQSPPPQATQDEGESVRIEYNDSEQAAARAQILKTLAQAKQQAPRAAPATAEAVEETPATGGGGRSLRKRTRA